MTSSPSSSDASPTAADGHAPLAPRRSVLVHLVTAVLSFVIVTIPATLGGLFFLDPIVQLLVPLCNCQSLIKKLMFANFGLYR